MVGITNDQTRTLIELIGETMVFNPATPYEKRVSAIFDSLHYEIDENGVVISTNQPKITVTSEDISDIASGDTILAQATLYRIDDIQHDGAGVSVIFLSK